MPAAAVSQSLTRTERRCPPSWARLISRVFHADPLVCRHVERQRGPCRPASIVSSSPWLPKVNCLGFGKDATVERDCEYMRTRVGPDTRPGSVVSIARAATSCEWHPHGRVLHRQESALVEKARLPRRSEGRAVPVEDESQPGP